MRLGVVVNPIAGMGGRVGLKGTDGKLEEALALGAEPRAPDRARRAFETLHRTTPDATVYTWGDPMGERELRAAGFEPVVLGRPGSAAAVDSGTTVADAGGATSVGDTRAAVRAFADEGVDLVLFVGGDGTAVDVAETLDEVAPATPMLGVPAGVKVYSSVFAVSPEDAGEIAATFERTERREVMDIDEDDYRAGEVHPELRAVVRVPVAEDLQASKQPGGGTVEALAAGVAADVEPGTTYVLGPGSTVGAIKAELGFDGTLLGVDVWRATGREADGRPVGEILVRDASESAILDALDPDGRNVIVVSPIGGQGFVFGRGNPQLSPTVIRQCDVEVVASRAKLDELTALRVDTDDPDLDEALRGWAKVRVGRVERRMMRIE